MFTITAPYAALLGLLFVLLSLKVIGVRRSAQIALGDGANPELLRRTRVHANFTEYVPIALMLIALLEAQGKAAFAPLVHSVIVHTCCIALLVGRCVHAYGVSQGTENLKFRVTGMLLTFTAIITSSSTILVSLLLDVNPLG